MRSYNLWFKLVNDSGTTPQEHSLRFNLRQALISNSAISTLTLDLTKPMQHLHVTTDGSPLHVCIDWPQNIFIESHLPVLIKPLSSDKQAQVWHLEPKKVNCLAYHTFERETFSMELFGNFDGVKLEQSSSESQSGDSMGMLEKLDIQDEEKAE